MDAVATMKNFGMTDLQLSRALGIFSIGLGVVELFAARRAAWTVGDPGAAPLIRGFGAREIATGLVILGNPDAPAGIWARVGGDILDLAVLGRLAGDRWNPRRGNAMAVLAAVAGVTLVDIAAALLLHERAGRAGRTARRTRVDPATERHSVSRPAGSLGRPHEASQATSRQIAASPTAGPTI